MSTCWDIIWVHNGVEFISYKEVVVKKQSSMLYLTLGPEKAHLSVIVLVWASYITFYVINYVDFIDKSHQMKCTFLALHYDALLHRSTCSQ